MIDGVARDGGYIMDASAIVQNDAKVENMQAMTDFAREYGVYSDGHSSAEAPCAKSNYRGTSRRAACRPRPGTPARPGPLCRGTRSANELGELSGSVPLLQNIWEGVDGLAYTYIWQLLLSF